MAKHNRNTNNGADNLNNTWVLNTKREGDRIGSWVIERLFDKNTRQLSSGERCKITSCCYPSGTRLVRAKLSREKQPAEPQTLAS